MNKLLSLLLVAAIGANGAFAVYQVRHTEPTDQTLEADLQKIAEELKDAESDADTFGGLIAAQADLRKAVLQSTQAALLQKKITTLRSVSMRYTVNGKEWIPSDEKIKQLDDDILKKKIEIKHAEQEAGSYGGLLKALALSRAMTEKTNLALLEQKRVAMTHGVPAPIPNIESEDDQPSIGNVVEDDNAL